MIKKKLLATLSIAAALLLSMSVAEAKPKFLGAPLPKEDFIVAGVPMGAYLSEIKQSLGEPTSERKRSLIYGGLEFTTPGIVRQHEQEERKMEDGRISYIEITNRDATTARGIAVGDPLKMVEAAYGKPIYKKDKSWFYGFALEYSDFLEGIYFDHNGKKVTRIRYFGPRD